MHPVTQRPAPGNDNTNEIDTRAQRPTLIE
jgi:hypothetical protein